MAAFFDQVPVSNIEDLSQIGCNQDFLIDHEPLQNFMCEMSMCGDVLLLDEVFSISHEVCASRKLLYLQFSGFFLT
jgi:hypothetical protein